MVPTRNTHLALAEDDLDLAGLAREQALHLGQALRRHEDLLALLEHAHALQVAQREPVRVGGDEPQPAGRRGEQHAGEDRAGVVARRGRDHLAQRLGERRRLDRHAIRSASGSRGNSVADSVRRVVAKRPASILASSSAELDRHRVAVELRARSRENKRAGTTALPSPSLSAGMRDPDRELEVGADQLERAGAG